MSSPQQHHSTQIRQLQVVCDSSVRTTWIQVVAKCRSLPLPQNQLARGVSHKPISDGSQTFRYPICRWQTTISVRLVRNRKYVYTYSHQPFHVSQLHLYARAHHLLQLWDFWYPTNVNVTVGKPRPSVCPQERLDLWSWICQSFCLHFYMHETLPWGFLQSFSDIMPRLRSCKEFHLRRCLCTSLLSRRGLIYRYTLA